MKLELKHLAPYLPYGLNWFCLDIDSREFECLPTIKLLDLVDGTFEIGGMDVNINELPNPNGLTIKPILRPLSDLLIKGELNPEFNTITSVHFNPDYNDDLVKTVEDFINYDNQLKLYFPFEFWQLLFKHHFDVFGLIEKGLAIDINKLD